MKLNLNYAVPASLFFITLFLLTSCSKDSDLLSDFVISDSESLSKFANLVVDDTYYVSMNTSTVLDVLNNDQFSNLTNVTVVNTTAPANGTVVINEDNTLTYTPPAEAEETTETEPSEEPETIVDSFVYTAEETGEDGTVTAEEGTVTVSNIENRTPISGDNVYFVTISGKSSNSGASESTSWDLKQAFAVAKPGDIVYIKAGNYGALNLRVSNSGTADKPIKFIGYKITPGDILANNGSTFKFGDNVDASKMPLLKSNGLGTGIVLLGKYVEINNIQLKDYSLGIDVRGNNNTLDNAISVDMGKQTLNQYDGFGIKFSGSYNTIKNSYIENATAEAFKVYGGTNNLIQFLEVRADNITNPTDYYILLSNTKSNIVEDSRVERAPGLVHGGHGLTCKWNSKDNVFRRCETVYTNIEMNFEDVTGNLYENINMKGQGTTGYYWHTNIDFRNGANRNTVRNITMTNVWSAVNFSDDNDGFKPSPDTDAVKCGSYNKIESLTVKNCQKLFQFIGNVNIGGSLNASATGNIFDKISVDNYNEVGTIYTSNSGNQINNSTFKNHIGTSRINVVNGKQNNVTFSNTTFN